MDLITDDPFDSISDCQMKAYNEGFEEGVQNGKKAAFVQGFKVGQKMAFNIAKEMGQYQGSCEVYKLQNKHDDTNEKALKLASQICELIQKCDFVKCHEDSFTGNLTLIREKYTRFCSLTNIKNYFNQENANKDAVKLMF